MASKKISQETFDEVVRENIEDFDHSPEEAIRDAIDQFKKQGIDLSNIDKTGGIGRQEMLDALESLVRTTELKAPDDIISAVDSLSQLCSKSNEMSTRNIMLMKEKNGANALHILLEPDLSPNALGKVMVFLGDLSKASEGIRDFFEPGGSDRLCKILKAIVEADEINKELLISALGLAKVVIRTENNKNMIMKAGLGDIIASLIVSKSGAVQIDEWACVLQPGCQLVRGLCIHDDLRKDMSCAYDNGRFFMRQPGFAQALMQLSGTFQQHPALASAALLAARNLINTEEAVAIMSKHGAIELIKAVLAYKSPAATGACTTVTTKTSSSSDDDNAEQTDDEDSADAVVVALVKSAVALMRNVCADDKRKDRVVSEGILDLLVAAMSGEAYAKDGALMEHAIACLAQISLRSPSNAQRIVSTGRAVDIVATSMRRHADRPALLRQGALTVRNIAGRCPELRGTLLDAGLEDILRGAGRYMDVVDEAYAALRDLGCEVQYVKVSADGSVAPAYEQFGGPTKLRFNPIYDEADNIEDRVAAEARAPFASEMDDEDEEGQEGQGGGDGGNGGVVTGDDTNSGSHVHSASCAH